MKLGVAINVFNKPFEVVENIRAWKIFFKTPTRVSLYSNGVDFRRFPYLLKGADFYTYKLQYRGKRTETPLTLIEAAIPLLNSPEKFDFILFLHCDYFYLDELKLLDVLSEVKTKNLGGCAHLDCSFCRDSSEFKGIRGFNDIKGKMGDVRAVSAYCLILTPEFINDYKFLEMKPFDSEGLPNIEDGGTADTFTEHFYNVVGPNWTNSILDLPRHGMEVDGVKYNSIFPDVMMIHSHLEISYIQLKSKFFKGKE